MEEDIIPDPGVIAQNAAIPQDQGGPANLSVNFSPSLENLLPQTSQDQTMDPTDLIGDLGSLGSSSGVYTSPFNVGGFGASLGDLNGATGSLTTTGNSLDSSILGFGESIGTSLLGAFVTNPQNAKTAEQQSILGEQLSLASSSQLFTYLLIGLGIFLIFQFAEKK